MALVCFLPVDGEATMAATMAPLDTLRAAASGATDPAAFAQGPDMVVPAFAPMKWSAIGVAPAGTSSAFLYSLSPSCASKYCALANWNAASAEPKVWPP